MLSRFLGPESKNCFQPVRFGLAGGIVWGGAIFLLTLLSLFLPTAPHWLLQVATYYPGYSVSFAGSFAGLLCGFIDGFLFFFLIGWVYNRLYK